MKLAQKLDKKIQIMKAIQTPNAFGGFDKTYNSLLRIWAGIKLLNVSSNGGYQQINFVETSNIDTHEFIVRYESVINSTTRQFNDSFFRAFDSVNSNGFGREFNLAYTTEFDNIIDTNPIKSDYFVFLEFGSAQKGKLFKITKCITDDVTTEYMLIRCRMEDERGTGFNEVN